MSVLIGMFCFSQCMMKGRLKKPKKGKGKMKNKITPTSPAYLMPVSLPKPRTAALTPLRRHAKGTGRIGGVQEKCDFPSCFPRPIVQTDKRFDIRLTQMEKMFRSLEKDFTELEYEQDSLASKLVANSKNHRYACSVALTEGLLQLNDIDCTSLRARLNMLKEDLSDRLRECRFELNASHKFVGVLFRDLKLFKAQTLQHQQRERNKAVIFAATSLFIWTIFLLYPFFPDWF